MKNQKNNHQILENQLDEIANCLINLKQQVPTFGLYSGKAGIALFYCYYASLRKDKSYLTIADDILGECFDGVFPKNYTGHNYFRELAELGVFLIFAKKNKWIESAIEPFLISLDAHLYSYQQKKIAQDNLDVYAGALSSGWYFLNRPIESEVAQKALTELVEAIDRLKVESDKDGYFWKSPIFNDDRVYTGISHGSAMIINFLLKTFGREIEIVLSEKLMKGAANYLLNLQNEDDSKAIFPSIVGDKNESIQLSFCYGDLGTLLVLLKYTKVFNNSMLYAEVLKELHRLGAIDDPKKGQILDAEITYGAAGTAIMFDTISNITKDNVFESYANFWYNKIPKFATFQNETLGYQAIFNQYSTATNISFSEGIAGIGIALMRYLNKKMPPIDELIGL